MRKTMLRSLWFETRLKKITLVSSVFFCVEKETSNSGEKERSLCFSSKRIRDTDYTRLQQNRKVSLTGNENLASNEALRLKQPLYLRLHDTPNRAKTIFQTRYFFK